METAPHTRANFEIMHPDGRATQEFAQLALTQMLMDGLVQSHGQEHVGTEEFRALLSEARQAIDTSTDAVSLVKTLQRITDKLTIQ